MYLFTRRARLRTGNPADGTAWAIGITERVHQITGLDVGLWQSMFGPEVGLLAWSTFVPDLAALETAFDKLAADPSFVSDIEAGQRFVPDGADDRLLRILHPEAERLAEQPATPPTYATVTSTVCMAGSYGRGIELGIQLAQEAERVTGVPALFGMEATGMYGAVAWVAGYADVEAMETAETALALDPDFSALIDGEVAGVYDGVPSMTTQTIYRRIV